ncbi:MAG: hypothetical protein ACJ8R9_16635 [Steroidobacteraceae bacterium]
MLSRNQIRKARTVLESLIQGLDPETGEDLPKTDTANRIEVTRSMSIALTALKEVDARMVRRSLLPESVGKTWTDEEEQQLKAEFANSEPIPDIATRHGRTIRAIEARLERVGLLRPDQRTTSDSFMG